ncbi:MarR family winged helix-turn-helix transcriptional regulator [Litchfieldia alkalitelluris]|uniref:MarR family winged helix-turn-helix transcriptional regulator n=1 Tax=Litchfieldia alkalitelluris TaxID=304268 RepID=UPI0009970107|nr:MarR family transcriptional regulator [Litchfieldia alkalitelluris]
MNVDENFQLINCWLSLSQIQIQMTTELENILQQKHQLSLNEFYVLLFLAKAPENKLKLQELQNMVGLSQSAMSRLISRFEAKGCGTLKRHICVEDRRAIYTSLTNEGAKKLKDALTTFNETLGNTLSEGNIKEELLNLIDQFR